MAQDLKRVEGGRGGEARGGKGGRGGREGGWLSSSDISTSGTVTAAGGSGAGADAASRGVESSDTGRLVDGGDDGGGI